MSLLGKGVERRLLFCFAASCIVHFWIAHQPLIARMKNHSSKRIVARLLPPATVQKPPLSEAALVVVAPSAELAPEPKPEQTPPPPMAPVATPAAQAPKSSPAALAADPASSEPNDSMSFIAGAYFSGTQLTEHPAFGEDLPESFVAMPFPSQDGRLVVTLYLSPNGKVDRLVVEESSMNGRQEDWLIEQIKARTIFPGKINGTSVATKWTLEFSADAESAPHAASSSNTSSTSGTASRRIGPD